jgi:hypothetical protein
MTRDVVPSSAARGPESAARENGANRREPHSLAHVTPLDTRAAAPGGGPPILPAQFARQDFVCTPLSGRPPGHSMKALPSLVITTAMS